MIGEGGFGPVYRGCLPDGSRIAVKVNRSYNAQRGQEFWREVHCSFEHPAIVKMLGWCALAPAPAKSRRRLFFFRGKKEEHLSDGRRELCIVMEYLERGSLHDQLFENNVRDLDWPVRLKICIGASAGISFLHKEGIVNRDIKPANILLDKNFSPKISDFSSSRVKTESTSGITSEILDHTVTESFISSALSQDVDGVTTALRGTVGYLDPEYIMPCRAGPKSDVYSFGMTLLNVVSGSRAYYIDRDLETLLDRARRLFRENRIRELVDSKMARTIEDVTAVKEVVRIALLCSEPKSEDRPTMDEVHSMLLKVGSEH